MIVNYPDPNFAEGVNLQNEVVPSPQTEFLLSTTEAFEGATRSGFVHSVAGSEVKRLAVAASQPIADLTPELLTQRPQMSLYFSEYWVRR